MVDSVLMLDVFTPDAFSVQTLTATLNKMPYKPGWLSAQGLFTSTGVSTNTISIEEYNGVLRLVQSAPRGAPRRGGDRTKRKLRSFVIPHFPQDDVVRATEVQGVRAFGMNGGFQTVEAVRDERLQRMADNNDVTLEYNRIGAVKGQVLDADGSILIDLFDEFDVDQNAVITMPPVIVDPNASLSDQQAEVTLAEKKGVLKKLFTQATRGILNNLTTGGDPAAPTGWIEICGDDYYDYLISHPELRDTYKFQNSNVLRAAAVFDSFIAFGIQFVNYRGGGFNMVDTNEGHLFPTGIQDLFITRFGPADYIETVNTIGLPRYSKAVIDPWGKHVEMEFQSNFINLCLRPNVLQTFTL